MPEGTRPWLLGCACALLLGCGGAEPDAVVPPTAATVLESAAAPDVPVPASEIGSQTQRAGQIPGPDEDEPLDTGGGAELEARIQGLLERGTRPALRRALRVLLARREQGEAIAMELADRVVRALLDWDELALQHEAPVLAQRDLPLLQQWAGDDARIQMLAARLEQVQRIVQELARADHLQAGGQWIGSENSAVSRLREVLRLQPGHPGAMRRLVGIERSLAELAVAAARAGDFDAAAQRLAEAGKVLGGSEVVQAAAERVRAMREVETVRQLARISAALAVVDLESAQALLPRLDAIALDEQAGITARAEIRRAQLYARWDVGALIVDVLASGGLGPGMVVIPAGQFQMGSPRSQAGHQSNEGRQHPVRFARGFALARTEVTVGQFRRFIEASERRTTAQRRKHSLVYDERGGALVEKRRVTWRDDYTGKRARDDMPVLHVSWNDAQAYVKWLAQETGASYRLPSEAEFEYALRAGSVTVYPWGDGSPPANTENLTGALDQSPSRRSWGNAFEGYGDGHWGPAPVASFASNAFGLNDMNGNVSEWVADCWHDSYARAPTDGTAWVNPGCKERVIRGASWASSPMQARSASRIAAAANTVNARVGFRVVRELHDPVDGAAAQP